MTIADLDTAETQAFAAKRDAWASVVFARTAEELDQATVRYQRAVAAYGQASRDRYNAQSAQPGRQVF